jgi:hypothetical protein
MCAASQDDNLLEQLILSIFPFGECRKVGFFSVHYDDSGTAPDQSVALAAAYIASPEQWKEFQRNWTDINQVEQFGVFHMSEFAAKQKGTVFEHWDDNKRERVLKKLCSTITTRVRIGIARAVMKSDYDEVITGDFRDHCGHFHYTFALRQCAGLVGKWREKYSPNSALRYTFDWMTKGEAKSEISSVMDTAVANSEAERLTTGVTRFMGYSFERKSLIFPLQAADILAWTIYQQMQRIIWDKKLTWEAEMAYGLLKNSCSTLDDGYFVKERLIAWAGQEQKALNELRGRVLGAT